MVSLRSFLSGAALLLASAFSFQACSQQGEAMRCEVANGNNDCESPLICQANTGGKTSEPICCPADRANATTDDCKSAGTSVVVDSGTSDTATTDTGSATDTGAKDGATDAASEAATDTGAATDTATTDADAAG